MLLSSRLEPHRTRRTQAERSASTREALIVAAVKSIAELGYDGATTERIAAAAGVSKGALTFHFSAKEALLAPVLERCKRALHDAICRAYDEASAGHSGAEALRRGLRAVLTSRFQGMPELEALADLLARGGRDKALRAPVRAALEAAERALSERVLATAEGVGLRPRIPRTAIGQVLLALIEGMATRRALSDETDDEGARAALEVVAGALFTL